MEVCVASQVGIPQDAIISVRAGSVKRQALSTSSKPFRFAASDAKDSLLKFDILQTVGTGYAVLKPHEDRYKVVFKDDMACEIDIRHVDSAGVADALPEAARPGSGFNMQGAQAYLEEHGVLQFIQGMIQAIVKEKPSDPYKYMIRHLNNGFDADARPICHDAKPVEIAETLPNQSRAMQEKCAASAGDPVQQVCKTSPHAQGRDSIADLREQAKSILMQGLQDGSLEENIKGDTRICDVQELRQKANLLFVQGLQSGSLGAALAQARVQDAEKTSAETAAVQEAEGEQVVAEVVGEGATAEATTNAASEAAPLAAQQLADSGATQETPAAAEGN